MKLRPAILAAAALCSCGYVGEPLPPALNTPSAVNDLRAIEYGDQILLQFTLPNVTTDNLPFTRPRSVEIFAGPAANPYVESDWAASAMRFEVPSAAPGPLEHRIPARPFVNQLVVVRVRATGPTGRASAFSNVVLLPIAEPLPRPAAFTAVSDPRGVALNWTGNAPRYRVLRSTEGGALEQLAETESPEFVDDAVALGARYQYTVVALSGEAQQSLPSEPAAITPADTFPPAVPAGLTAVAGTQSIGLSWARNQEEDLRAYNVYRSVDGGPFTLLASPDTPAYTDTTTPAGRRYSYTVSAVDATGNESARSAPIEAAIP